MIAFISIIYGLFYYLVFNVLKLLKKTPGNIAAFVGVGVVMIASILFMWNTFSPISQDARVFRYIIPIVPNVRGTVLDVPVQPNVVVPKGTVLYHIDPKPYEYQVLQAEASVAQFAAQETLSLLQVERAQELLKTQAVSKMDLDRWTAQLEADRAGKAGAAGKLANALWELDETEVTAPTKGYVVNLQLRPGSFVGSTGLSAAMSFISKDTTQIMASFSQSAIRRIQQGDPMEITFPHKPGEVFAGTVADIVAFSASSQLQASGTLPSDWSSSPPDRWAVRATLDDAALAEDLPQGTAGSMAIFTNGGKPVHVISKVVLRMNAWMAYLTSP
ncbi:MAG: efflux RND transporter periplasmic adaptor subunit [Halioglobus sp.]